MLSTTTDSPFLIMIGGPMGSGKTTVGQALNSRFNSMGINSKHIDIDDIAKLHKPTLEGVAAYAFLEKATHKSFSRRQPIVLSGTFRDAITRIPLEKLALNHGYKVLGCFLQPPLDEAVNRAKTRALALNDSHLLKANDVSHKIADWAEKFQKGNHHDLKTDPWTVYEGIYTTQQIIDFTMERLGIKKTSTPELSYSPSENKF